MLPYFVLSNGQPRLHVRAPFGAAVYPFASTHFQSLTNCSALSPHADFLCFHALAHCPIYNPFVLMTLQQWGGCGGTEFRFSHFEFPIRGTANHWITEHLQCSLQICSLVFNNLQDAPPATPFLSSFCMVARGWVSPKILRTPTGSHSCTSHESRVTSHRTLSPLECAVPRSRALSALECAVTKTRSRNPFRMRSSEKRWGGRGGKHRANSPFVVRQDLVLVHIQRGFLLA